MRVVEVKTKVPSYLKPFHLEWDEINLIFARKPSVHLDSASENIVPLKNSESFIEGSTLDVCELTGTPLQVDLGGADDSVLEVKADEVRNLWPAEECRHFPLPILDARKLLSEYCSINPVKFNQTKTVPPAFVICDGKDREKCTILGVDTDKMPMSLKILNLGCLVQDDAFQVGDMLKTHLQQVESGHNRSSEVKSEVTIKYDIYGKSLTTMSFQNALMRNGDKHAYVCLDVFCKKCVLTPSEYDPSLKMNLNLEIVSGHELLLMHDFWKELCLLQSLLDLLFDSKSCSNENTVVCHEPWETKKIFQKISMLVTTSTRFLEKRAGIDIDLNNLRELDILDKSWDILKNCENLYVLRESIHHLFEEIADSDINMPVPDIDTNIAIVINGIMNKHLLLTQINVSQTLDFLFELGARKLKKDYQAILAHFCPSARSKIDSVFRSFFTKYSLSQDNMRRTTVSQNIKVNRLDNRVEQLGYLAQLHVASEFIFLVREQVNLLEESFYKFCKFICNEYVENSTKITDFSEVYQSPLKQISLELFPKEARIVQNLFPARWTLEMMSSTSGNTQVTTIYDLSQSPIFPPGIVNYDVPMFDENLDNKMMYYVACLQKRVGYF